MYPMGCVSPKFYGLHKIHMPDTPLRPIVSSCGSVTYCVAKELAKILKPLVSKSPHHINSTYDFVEQIMQLTLLSGECLSSYDVSAMFTSVQADSALGVIKDLLEEDPTLKELQLMTLFHYWNFVSKTCTFHSKTSSMNRLRVWLWVPQSAPL